MKWAIPLAISLILLILLTAGCLDSTEEGQPATPTPSVTESTTPSATQSPTETPVKTSTATSTPTLTPETTPMVTPAPQTYRVYVDDDYGFHMIRHLSDHPRTDINVKNLTINVGDTVIWHNNDDESDRVDIISNDGLWNINDTPQTALMWSGREFHYTFTKPGTYTFSLGYYPRVYRKLGNQTITVE